LCTSQPITLPPVSGEIAFQLVFRLQFPFGRDLALLLLSVRLTLFGLTVLEIGWGLSRLGAE